jgi:glutathione reductase (NADPH)
MIKRYQLAIIGTGTAAMVAAMRVRAAGWRVVVIDFRPFGGTCALRGCDPKKMLIGGVEAADHAWRMKGRGVAGDTRLDWFELMAFKRSFTDPVPAKRDKVFAEKGIDTLHGRARFTAPNVLDIEGELIEADHVLIASGAEAIPLGIVGEEHLVTNEAFLALETLPPRIVLVGGGYIASEFSHIAARAGAKVTIFQHGERMLTQFDPDLVGWLMDKFEELGIDVRTDTAVTAIDKTADGFCVRANGKEGEIVAAADMVIHAAGRAPALTELDLAAAGVAVENGRLVLNEFLQSVTNQSVYAAGDAAGRGPPLTPVSSHDAKVVAANLLHGNNRKPNYHGVPSVAFTIPPIAAVGMTEAAAHEAGLDFSVNSERVDSWFTARQQAETLYGYKLLVDNNSDLILGAHLVGPHVDETINLFALAIKHGLTATQVKSMMFAYPTGASDVGEML